ncbi:MAG: hypothetical protein AAF211_24625 [Myxococcota bacterium]
MLLWLATAFASPTHGDLESAAWRPLDVTKTWGAGDVRLSTTEIGEVSCFRAEATIPDLGLDALFDVATDPVSATAWSRATRITEGTWLSRTEDVLEYYQYLDVALVSDRFWFLRARLERNEGRRVLRWQPLPPDTHMGFVDAMRSRNHAAVEPSINIGGWYFTSVDGGVQVVYQLCSRSGTLARWIQDRAVRAALPYALGDLVAEARRR